MCLILFAAAATPGLMSGSAWNFVSKHVKALQKAVGEYTVDDKTFVDDQT